MAEADTTTSTRWARVAAVAPMAQWLPGYQRSRLTVDLLAGAIVAALLVPQSLGCATIAGVPVQLGLYAVPLALLAYAVLGSSPQLIVGPASTVAIVSGSLVADISRDNPQDAVAITSALAIAAGIGTRRLAHRRQRDESSGPWALPLNPPRCPRWCGERST